MPIQCRSYIVSILILEWSRGIEPLNYVCLLTKLYLSRLYVRRSCVVFGQLGISDVEAKGTLLRRGIMFNHNKVDLYAVNSNDTDISQCNERVLIKGLSFWNSYALILEYEKTVSQITICPSVYQSRSRNNITNSTSTCLNGDRLSTMTYTPSTLIGAVRRLFMSHPALIANPELNPLSFNISHRTDDHAVCPLYIEPRDNVVAFFGGVFSNFNKRIMTLQVEDMEFATSEHA